VGEIGVIKGSTQILWSLCDVSAEVILKPSQIKGTDTLIGPAHSKLGPFFLPESNGGAELYLVSDKYP
jgi:hypothetical protein